MKKELIEEFIRFIGDNPAREGLQETPAKVLESLEHFFSGYNIENPKELINKIKLVEKNNNIIIIKSIDFYSFCEHHILPIIGKINIGYVANQYIASIGSLIRIVSAFTKRLQLQERIAAQISEAIEEILDPLGVITHIEAKHMCLRQPNNISIVTLHTTGIFSTEHNHHNNNGNNVINNVNNNINSNANKEAKNYVANSRIQEFLTMIGK